MPGVLDHRGTRLQALKKRRLEVLACPKLQPDCGGAGVWFLGAADSVATKCDDADIACPFDEIRRIAADLATFGGRVSAGRSW